MDTTGSDPSTPVSVETLRDVVQYYRDVPGVFDSDRTNLLDPSTILEGRLGFELLSTSESSFPPVSCVTTVSRYRSDGVSGGEELGGPERGE